jgi:hypothetical protein
MLNVIMLNVIMLNVIMLNVIMLNVNMLSVVVLNVVSSWRNNWSIIPTGETVIAFVQMWLWQKNRFFLTITTIADRHKKLTWQHFSRFFKLVLRQFYFGSIRIKISSYDNLKMKTWKDFLTQLDQWPVL